MARRPHWILEAADRLREEMRASAAEVAERLAPPAESFDGQTVSRRVAIEIARAESYRDPMYLAKDLDRMAPRSIKLPDGRELRAQTGLENFLAKWRVVRPDLFALLEMAGPAGVQPVAPAPPAPMPGAPPPPPAGPPAPPQQIPMQPAPGTVPGPPLASVAPVPVAVPQGGP